MNPYHILNVDKDSTQEEIKAAYQRLRSSSHPDRGGEASMFDKIQKAYEILSDSERRKQFDLHGETEFKPDNIHEEIGSLFLQCLNHSDPVKAVKEINQMNRHRTQSQVASLKQQIKGYKKKVSRIRKKGEGLNFLKEVVEIQIRNSQQAIKKGEELIDLCNRIEAVLNDYSFDPDESEQKPVFITGLSINY